MEREKKSNVITWVVVGVLVAVLVALLTLGCSGDDKGTVLRAIAKVATPVECCELPGQSSCQQFALSDTLNQAFIKEHGICFDKHGRCFTGCP
jgi:hypothetical protein